MEPSFSDRFGDIFGEAFGKSAPQEKQSIADLLRKHPNLVTRAEARRIFGYQLLILAASARHLSDVAKKA